MLWQAALVQWFFGNLSALSYNVDFLQAQEKPSKCFQVEFGGESGSNERESKPVLQLREL